MTMFILSSLLCLYVFFALLMVGKAMILRNGWQNKLWARLVTKVFGGLFYGLDIGANYVCFAPVVLHWPNVESRTITDHANLLIGEYLTDIRPGSSWLDNWRLDCSMFVCKHLNSLDNGHCENLK